MSVFTILRLSMMCIFALLGWLLGFSLSSWIPHTIPLEKGYYPFVVAFIGAIFGFVVVPRLLLEPGRALRSWLKRIPVSSLLMGIVGIIIGLLIAALLALPLSVLPDKWGQFTPFALALVLSFLGAVLMLMHAKEVLSLFGLGLEREGIRLKENLVLLDTSVIIDGRVADICQTGFLSGTMIVPRFVLNELQHVADSSDDLRRRRGRRGLDVLNRMQQDENIPIRIEERDLPNVRNVDAKLVRLAQELECPILTNDYNLNRVAELQGIQVLNINELANTVKTVVLPGETLRVQVIQEGKEPRQGLGYLDDGTMIVIEDGERFMNTEVDIEVTRVLQTVAGRMIFGQIKGRGR